MAHGHPATLCAHLAAWRSSDEDRDACGDMQSKEAIECFVDSYFTVFTVDNLSYHPLPTRAMRLRGARASESERLSSVRRAERSSVRRGERRSERGSRSERRSERRSESRSQCAKGGEGAQEKVQNFLTRLNDHNNLNICVTRITKKSDSIRSSSCGGGDSERGEGRENKILFNLEKINVLPKAQTLIVNKYPTVDSIVQAVAASSYIPMYSKMDLRGAKVLDQMSMDNLSHLLRALHVAGKSIWKQRSIFTQMKLPTAVAVPAGVREIYASDIKTEEELVGIEEEGEGHIVVVDGGVTALMPPLGDITCGPMSHIVAPFLYQPHAPYRQPVIAVGVPEGAAGADTGTGSGTVTSTNTNINTHPTLDMCKGSIKPMKASLFQLAMWAAKPPDETVLRALFAEGRRASRQYAHLHLEKTEVKEEEEELF